MYYLAMFFNTDSQLLWFTLYYHGHYSTLKFAYE